MKPCPNGEDKPDFYTDGKGIVHPVCFKDKRKKKAEQRKKEIQNLGKAISSGMVTKRKPSSIKELKKPGDYRITPPSINNEGLRKKYPKEKYPRKK